MSKRVHTIDIETGGFNYDSVIFSVGIATFMANGQPSPISVIEKRLKVTPQLEAGRVASPATITEFWNNPAKVPAIVRERSIPPGLRDDGTMDPNGEFADALTPQEFMEFLKGFIEPTDIVIGNGPEFDIAFLTHFYNNSFPSLGYRIPWDYRRTHSYRTIKLLMQILVAEYPTSRNDEAIEYLGPEALLIDNQVYLHVAAHDAVVEAIKIRNLFIHHFAIYLRLHGATGYHLDTV